MNISRHVLCDLPGVYSVSVPVIDEKPHILAASEHRGGSCVLIDPRSRQVSTVWKEPGGTMSLVPIDSDRFFAVQKFYAGFDAAASIIAEARAERDGAGPWKVTEQMKLPYLHRLAKVGSGDQTELLACTLCGGKDNVDDWVRPGGVYRISPSKENTQSWKAIPILEGIRRNHGLSVTTLDQTRVALISGIEGIFAITLPGNSTKAWDVKQLVDWDVSDMAVIDWDGDGREEMVTIEPFHGDRFVFYRRDRAGHWQRIHEMTCQLGHSLWAGETFGRKALILGERMGKGQIRLVFPTAEKPSTWQTLVIDSDTGGTNVAVVHATKDQLQFVSANNDNNQVVLYTVER
jgi:hypothetical protein